MTCVWVCECAVCQGTGGGGFHGYYGIPAWLSCQCDGGGVIHQLRCLRCWMRKTRKKKKRRRKIFSFAFHYPGALCLTRLEDPVHLPEESLVVHLHTGAHLLCRAVDSGWNLLGPLVLSEECWSVEEIKKHHYGPQGGDLHSSVLSWMNIHLSDPSEKQDLVYFSASQHD